MEDSTEALARSQLEMLYQMGILERGSEDEAADTSDKHDAFLAALPPPASLFPMRRLRTSAANSGSSRGEDSDFDAESSLGSHNYDRRRRHRRSASSSMASSTASAPRPAGRGQGELRKWFRLWCRYVTRCRKDKLFSSVADQRLKQAAITKWARFLDRRRHDNEIKRSIDSWKVVRALSRWAEWKRRRRRLRALLNEPRRSFMSLLTQQRVFRRWVELSQRSMRTRRVLIARIQVVNARILRLAWHSFRIRVFRARQDRLVLRRCLDAMRELQAMQQRQRLTCSRYQSKVITRHKRSMLLRWRSFAYASTCERKLMWRVQFEVRRRRYFLLWCEAVRTNHLIARLRDKVESRTRADHFYAWKMAATAIRLSERVISRRHEQLRTVYFRAWKDQGQFQARCKQICTRLTRRRLADAVNVLHSWASARKHVRIRTLEIQRKWQGRLLRWVWSGGWMKLHRKILAVKHSQHAQTTRVFNTWRRYYHTRLKNNQNDTQACKLYDTLCCRHGLDRWKAYYCVRQKHYEQLARSDSYYQKRLLQKGISTLWTAAFRNTQNTLKTHDFRQKQRASLKKRCFLAWRLWTYSKLRRAERLHKFQQRPGYQNSLWNPSRRAWRQWILFVSICRKRHRSVHHYQVCLMRRILVSWCKQASLESRLKTRQQRKNSSKLELVFNVWRDRTGQWRKLRVICDLAEKVYERKLSIQVLRAWRGQANILARIHRCGEAIRRQYQLKQQTAYFLVWRRKLRLQQFVSRLQRGHNQSCVRACFQSWYLLATRRRRFFRKLTYFQQVYGKFPASSSVSRTWKRWEHFTAQNKYINSLHRRHVLRQVKLCWSSWKTFHFSYRIFYLWRRVALAMSKRNNKLGTRLRWFRESSCTALQRRMLERWKCMVYQRKEVQEKQSVWKHNLNRELENFTWSVRAAAHFQLLHWFRRWLCAQNKDSNLAWKHYCTCLYRKVFLSWLKATIHAKQERVLLEAQQTITKLSYYQPQSATYTVKSKGDTQRTLKETSHLLNQPNVKSEAMRSKRRMVDPKMQPTYSSKPHKEETSENLQHKAGGRSSAMKSKHPRSTAHRKYTHPTPLVNTELSTDRNAKSTDLKPDNDEQALSTESCPHGGSQEPCTFTPMTTSEPGVLPSLSLDYRPNNQNDTGDRREQNGARLEAMHLQRSDVEFSTQSSLENELPLFDYCESDVTSYEAEEMMSRIRSAPADADNNNLHEFSEWGSQEVMIQQTHNCSAETRDSKQHQWEAQLGPTEMPPAFDPSWSLENSMKNGKKLRHKGPHKGGIRKILQISRVKVVASSKIDNRSLGRILGLPETNGSEPVEQNGNVDAPSHHDGGNPVDDQTVIQDIVEFYVGRILVELKAGSDISDSAAKTSRIRVCFRMVRDLALFQNDFYIDEFIKVYDAVFERTSARLSLKFPEACKREECDRLHTFLERLIETHPGYKKRTDLNASEQAFLQLTPRRWLVRYHLQHHLELRKRARIRPRKHKPYWMWEAMPATMDIALEKLLPAITKYIRVLGQLFLRQAVRGASTDHDPQNFRISSSAFVSLMKQVRVFPQLFHRRELENAVQMSCCSNPESEELNFPEFVETLIRCSCGLRWGELEAETQDKSDATVTVIKFAMLIFAMEGQGSVLKKRDEDINAILSFIGQQKQRKQAEKLFRFRKMLAENKKETRTAGTRQVPSVWSQVRLQFSPQSSPTRSHNTFDELTQSWDGGSPRHALDFETVVFDAQTNQPFDLEESSPVELYEMERGPGPGFTANRVADTVSINSPGDVRTAQNVDAYLSSDIREVSLDDGRLQGTKTTTSTFISKEDADKDPLKNNVTTAISEQQTDIQGADDSSTAVVDDSDRLAEPLDKNEFLQEILRGIGDVELLLNQSKVSSGRSGLATRPVTTPDVSIESRMPSLSDLASQTFPNEEYVDNWDTTEVYGKVQSEVSIQDPLLNYLTNAERFTESTDTTSFVAIADLSGHAFSQADPPTTEEHSSLL